MYRGSDWLDAPNHYPNLSRLHHVTILEEYETSYPSDPSTHSLAVALVSFFILLSAGLLLFVFATPDMQCLRKCYRRVLGQSTDRSSSPSPNSAREDEEQSEATTNPLASTDAPRRGFGGIVTRTPTSFLGEHHEESASPPGERGTFEFEMTSPGGGLIII